MVQQNPGSLPPHLLGRRLPPLLVCVGFLVLCDRGLSGVPCPLCDCEAEGKPVNYLAVTHTDLQVTGT